MRKPRNLDRKRKNPPHTPAPWHIDPPTDRGDYPIREGADGYLIATVWHDDSQRQHADAKLVAASPKLLAACQALLNCYVWGTRVSGKVAGEAQEAINEATATD